LHSGTTAGYTHLVAKRLRIRLVRLITAVLAVGLAAGTLASCVTSSGSTAGRVTVTEGSAPAPEKPPAEVPTSKQGLEVVSDPGRAEVWVDGDYKGLTPFIVTDIPQGWHRIIVRKAGYREVSTWLQYTSDYMLYQTSLVRITGFLRISVTPASSVVTVGGTEVSSGLQELPVGTYPVLVRAFGYADFSEMVTISDRTVTPLTVTLAPAVFGINGLFLPHARVNPDNPGVIGSVEAQFSVTGPGEGQLEVYDKSSSLVYRRALPGFTTWDQSVVWDLRDATGKALPDGDYRFVISAQGSDGQIAQAEAGLIVDRTLKIAARTVWSGSSGLLYAPVAEVLPADEFQASFLGAAYSAGSVFRAPFSLGVRLGIGSALEIDATGVIIPSSVAVPFGMDAAIRWNFLSPKEGEHGLEAALEAKASFQYSSSPSAGGILLTDTFTDFTGLHVALPLQLVFGPVSFLGTIGLTGSLWSPYGTSTASAMAWAYLRGGILLDFGSLTAGLSAAVRTQPLPGGFPAIGSAVPLQTGAEVHWLVPGTRILVSAIVAGEFDSASSYYFMGGGGLGFLY
jgi:hypothetical protein